MSALDCALSILSMGVEEEEEFKTPMEKMAEIAAKQIMVSPALVKYRDGVIVDKIGFTIPQSEITKEEFVQGLKSKAWSIQVKCYEDEKVCLEWNEDTSVVLSDKTLKKSSFECQMDSDEVAYSIYAGRSYTQLYQDYVRKFNVCNRLHNRQTKEPGPRSFDWFIDEVSRGRTPYKMEES